MSTTDGRTFTYVTERGAVRLPGALNTTELAQWAAATALGIPLARWTNPGEPARFILVDKAPYTERTSCGLDSRTMGAVVGRCEEAGR